MTQKICCTHEKIETKAKSWAKTKTIHRVIEFNPNH